ncbi:hypothetical protein [Photobacterium sp. 1_MG-2023]|uniref:head-tail joining protein n=1 Tax=Photobacterium sp. 1_MG-2023 TaxID=3062646 RepID=UPI0026E460AF|nr:hypothetical protein [Photobacterium sp. 1_MG-2023]MDO6707925.1 hypothetical protein [Photobacterium sp. 1_MG-2023]
MAFDFDAVMETADSAIWSGLGEEVIFNGGQPVRVIWEDVAREFDVMQGTIPKLTLMESSHVFPRIGDRVERLKNGGIFTVSSAPVRENGTLVVYL